MSGPTTSNDKLTRRDLLVAGGAIALGATVTGAKLGFEAFREREIAGAIVGGASRSGHLLRAGKFPRPSEERECGIAIVGGGIAGLSAARKLSLAGREDFVMFELDSEIGGNSRSGRNEITAYPWAAHYVPLPGEDAQEVREFFEEIGAITGYDSRKRPIFNEYYLCADPHERMLMHGRWQETILPSTGLSPEDKRQMAEFHDLMESFRAARGRDGRRAFSIPVVESSRDEKFLSLDAVTFADFLAGKGLDCEPLRWYVDYCCRDDYGTEAADVSAWAGIHYFASRGADAANAESSAVLTWPEGNGFLVDRLKGHVARRVHTDAVVFNVEPSESGVIIDQLDARTGVATRWRARAAILATPLFVTKRILRGGDLPFAENLEYAPWMVANVSLTRLPGGSGAPVAWDNVSYHSRSLGYVVATHQNLKSRQGKSVVSYYLPLSGKNSLSERRRLQERGYEGWRDEVVADLERMHPGIRSTIERVDVWLWGHAMAKPLPGRIWGHGNWERGLHPRIALAHADLTGISIFEEAFIHGVRAAERALRASRRGLAVNS